MTAAMQITVTMRGFHPKRFRNEWSKRERAEQWLAGLTNGERTGLAAILADERGIARDWIEDHGGVRSFIRYYVWVEVK